MANQFHFFVLPFLLGVALLAIFSLWKYLRWIRSFNKLQRVTIRKNIWSWKFLPVLGEAFCQGLLHLRISRKNLLLGYMHRSLAFGWFLLIVVGAIQAFNAFPDGHPLYYAIFYNYFVHDDSSTALRNPELMANIMDALLLYVFSGLLLAACKRLWSRPMGLKRTTRHTLMDRLAKLSLWCIFPARLLAEGVTSAIYNNGGFLVRDLGDLIRTIGFTAHEFEIVCWFFYSLALGVFFTMMPFTRYMHIFTEVILIYLRRMGAHEDTNQKTGFTHFELSACARCGLCIDACPLNKELAITNVQGVYMLQSIRNLEQQWRQQTIAENCLLCGRCETDCPVNLELNAIRRQVRIKNKRPIDKQGNYEYLQPVKPFSAIGRVAYFGGCMSQLTPGIGNAMEAIFQAARQPYWYMDKERSICCGRPLLQQGFTNQAAELRRKNTELIVNSKATMLVTGCPICYQAFTKEYKLNIPVMHHSEYIAMLLKSEKLKVRQSDITTTYHDPCELGRGCGIYNEPRQVLQATTHLLKTKNERHHSFCCGYNLNDLAITNDQKAAIRNAALENLLTPQPDVVATACPACKKAFMRGQNLPIKDIAEIVADNLL